jgi:hypothetical protein
VGAAPRRIVVATHCPLILQLMPNDRMIMGKIHCRIQAYRVKDREQKYEGYTEA